MAGLLGVRLNLTNSVPIGLYIVTSSPDAALVEFCPPEPFGTLSRERGYRERSRFGCPDGAKPLMKPIAARAGDVVAMSAAGVAVDGKLIPHTAPLHDDSAGRPISACPFGLYPVQRGTIWVASSFNAHSFDSRYFGPILESAILHHLRPLWISE
ncbi:MAG: conjugative transfer signal peptidase TraF [Acidobacteriaceae bacterium]|nr:conjugative transfer signal peptidase TraF [Acidobacteriaceae bacterium]